MKNKILLLIIIMLVVLLAVIVFDIRQSCPKWIDCMPGGNVCTDVPWYCAGKTKVAV